MQLAAKRVMHNYPIPMLLIVQNYLYVQMLLVSVVNEYLGPVLRIPSKSKGNYFLAVLAFFCGFLPAKES